MSLSRRIFALLAAALLPWSAQAWAPLGHRLVGALAERHLAPATEAQVKALLAGEPDPTLAGVATWADDLRESDPERFKQTRAWHYVDHEGDGCAYDPPADCPDGNCVIDAIRAQRDILADRSKPLAERRDALKFLVHFVGDVHQPFHSGRKDDLGGNKFQISLRTRIEPQAYVRASYVDGVMGTNLHSVWDYYLLASHGDGVRPPSLDEYAARLDALPWPPRDTDRAATGPAAWAGESCRLIRSRQLYPPSHSLDDRYLDAERPLAEQRVRQAAYRLANLLDDALAPDAGTR